MNNKKNKKDNNNNNNINLKKYKPSNNIDIKLPNKSINSNLSEINEKEYLNSDLEDNKKNKHSSSFQQATELIHSIQSFFHSLKKSNSNNSDNLESLNSTPTSSVVKKHSLSDTNLTIKKDNQMEKVETPTTMEKIKIQRSKSIPFNNTNSTQRNSCHYHKRPSISSMASSVTNMSVNHDIGHHYDSESETNDSRIEYSTPKENDLSFSFSSCQSSFSFASAFNNKMAPGINNHNLEGKGLVPLSPTSISSEKSDLLSVTPHIIGPLEEDIIKEQDSSSVTETVTSSLPYEINALLVKDDLGKNTSNEKELVKEQSESLEKNEIIDNCNNNKKEKLEIESSDQLGISTNSIPVLLDQPHPSSSLSSIDIHSIQPSSPSSSTKKNIHKIDSKEVIEDKLTSSSTVSPSLSKPSTIKVKSPELFKIEPKESELIFKKSSPKVSKGKSMLLFSSSTGDVSKSLPDNSISDSNNTNEKGKGLSSDSLNKILKIDNTIDSEEKVSLSYKDVVVNNLVNNKEKSSVVNVNKGITSTSNVNSKNKESISKNNKLEVQDPKDKINKKTIKNGSKDNNFSPLYSNVLNEDTLVDSENSSFISNVVCVSESESTSIPTTNAFPGEITHSLKNKASNLIIEDIDDAEEEFIQINNDLENDNKLDTIKNEKERNEPLITIEDTNAVESSLDNTENKFMKDNQILRKPSNEILSINESLLKERNPKDNQNKENELQFSKETTSSIAINNSEKRDEDNYSYYSNAFSPEISISSVNSDDKYSKNYFEKPQYYRKNKNGKKSADFEKSIKEYAVSLEKEMMDFYTKNLPTEESKTRKLSLLKRIQKIFSDRYPTLGVKAHLFGSSANELGTYNSDVDICLTTKDRVDCELSDMEVIKKILEENGITKIRTTPNAKVPICNFVDPETNLSCDINVNNTIALYNTKMIQTYALIDERVKPLIMTIKYFAKQRMLNDAKTGTLSSYCWVNMVINFLQMRKPPILPCLHAMTKDIPQEERIIVDGIDCTIYTDLDNLRGFGKDNKETLYELIFGFFKTFACDFDYITDVVSVRSGCYKKKSDNGWNVSSNNTRIRNNYFCVEEPFNTTRNLANCANRYSVKGLRWEFKRAFKILKARGSLEELCEPYKPNPSNYAYATTYYYTNPSSSPNQNQNRVGIPENGNFTSVSNGTIHNDHLFISNPGNPFSSFKNGKNNGSSFPGSLNVADKNGNWRIRNNNPTTVNSTIDNSSFQNKKLAWNTKKKPTDANDTTSSLTPPGENYYYARRFPNDGSFMNNHYSNSVFINNKRNNNYSNNTNTNKNTYIDNKDIHTNRKHEKSNYISNKEMDEMDNEKVVIKHRFIEHHRNFDNSISSLFSSSPQYYYSNNASNSNINLNNSNTTVIGGNANYSSSDASNNNSKLFNNNNKTNNNFNRNNNSTAIINNASTYTTKNTNVNNKENSRSNESIPDSTVNTSDKSKNNMDQNERKKNKGKSECKDETSSKEINKEDGQESEDNDSKDLEEATNESSTSNKTTEDQSNSTNPVIINNFNNYYSYINQECSAQFYKQFGYIPVQDQKMALTEEGISKQQQNIINSARYPPYPIFINLNNPNASPVTTSSSGGKSKSNGESNQSMMAGYTASYPVISSNTYGHYYTKVNNVNLIKYFIPAQAAAHPPGSPYQSRAQPLGYAVETIPIIPATNQAVYNVASNSNITIPEGSLYHTYHSLVPVVVDNSLNPILASRENIPNDNSHEGVMDDKKELTNDNKNDRSSKSTFNGNKKYNGSKSEGKKSQWPNSQFHVNKANKKSTVDNNHKNGKQKSKEIDDGNNSNSAKDSHNSQKKKSNYNNGVENNDEYDNIKVSGNKIENFTIKNTGKSEGPTEFLLAGSQHDDNQAIISVDGNKSEEERTLYNEELCCEPGQIDSEEDESDDDCKGQSSNINIRNSVSGSKGGEILLNIKNKNSSIEINLENNIIVNDVLIDYKNNKEGKNINGKCKKSNDVNQTHDKRTEKVKSTTKGVSSVNSGNPPSKEKKNKKNNTGNNVNKNKDSSSKANNQNKNEAKDKVKRTGSSTGNQKNKNNSKNAKKEDGSNKGKRKNSVLSHKSRVNSFTVKDNKTHNNKSKEAKDKSLEKNKGDETTVITTVTTTIITNNSSNAKNIQNGNNNGTVKKEDNGQKNPANKKNTNKANKAKKQQKFNNKKSENDQKIANTTNVNTTTPAGNNNANNTSANNSSNKKKFKNSTPANTNNANNKNKSGKAKVEDNSNKNVTKAKGNKKPKKKAK